ncbi:hypothetical protein SFRURICE_008756 [Spodoptera frugiperda]|nr:hypothetical protein SFRURICE_008756 [Spodoptera frugiperda]
MVLDCTVAVAGPKATVQRVVGPIPARSNLYVCKRTYDTGENPSMEQLCNKGRTRCTLAPHSGCVAIASWLSSCSSRTRCLPFALHFVATATNIYTG